MRVALLDGDALARAFPPQQNAHAIAFYTTQRNAAFKEGARLAALEAEIIIAEWRAQRMRNHDHATHS
jgi:hypothetical protein